MKEENLNLGNGVFLFYSEKIAMITQDLQSPLYQIDPKEEDIIFFCTEKKFYLYSMVYQSIIDFYDIKDNLEQVQVAQSSGDHIALKLKGDLSTKSKGSNGITDTIIFRFSKRKEFIDYLNIIKTRNSYNYEVKIKETTKIKLKSKIENEIVDKKEVSFVPQVISLISDIPIMLSGYLFKKSSKKSKSGFFGKLNSLF